MQTLFNFSRIYIYIYVRMMIIWWAWRKCAIRHAHQYGNLPSPYPGLLAPAFVACSTNPPQRLSLAVLTRVSTASDKRWGEKARVRGCLVPALAVRYISHEHARTEMHAWQPNPGSAANSVNDRGSGVQPLRQYLVYSVSNSNWVKPTECIINNYATPPYFFLW